MSAISALLNPDPAPDQDQPRPTYPQSRNGSLDESSAKDTTYEAADALTALATVSSGQQYAHPRDLPSPTSSFSHAPRRTSSFSSHAAPVEPSPPVEQQQCLSPTLEQYHHSSKSPEEQRRHSVVSRPSEGPQLAPIQGLTSLHNDPVHEEPHPAATSYGKDVSQFVPPPSRGSEGSDSGRDVTQHREPAFVRDEATTSQIRQPEGASNDTPQPHPISIPPPLSRPDDSQQPSPTPRIKNEPTGTPREATPLTAIAPSEGPHSTNETDMDTETLKALEAVKQNELGLRAKKRESISEGPKPVDDPKALPVPSKKRAAPKSSAAANKKGTASKKTINKKRKVDAEPVTPVEANARRSGTPSSRTSKTPAKTNKKGSQAGTPALDSSPIPDNSSQAHASDDEEGDSSDDNTLYCICRKPDNHSWMIGCDGGCDDWFHGSCVNMERADEDLIDKFICPNCEVNGKGRTTWKPLCRREGCRKPARFAKVSQSKYCSDECGTEFFRKQLERTAGAKKTAATNKRSKRKPHKDADEETAMSEDEEPTPLGGVLRAKDLKALTTASKDFDAFKRLGSGVLSPPQTASPTRTDFDPNRSNGIPENLPLTQAETAHLAALSAEKKDLQSRLELRKDREKFVSLARERCSRIIEREKFKPKDFCGYDPRLTWSDTEFSRWRNSQAGRAAFTFNTLSPTAEQIASIPSSDSAMDIDTPPVDEMELLCTKKGCKKHPAWQKLNLQDARFEEVEVVEAIKTCEKEEREVRERAKRRGVKNAVVGDLTSGEGGGGSKEREGWAEAVS